MSTSDCCDHFDCKTCGKLFIPKVKDGIKDFTRCQECIDRIGYSEHARRQYPMRDTLQ